MKEEDVFREDVRKLHAEINQLVNQRILVTTTAVTVFGVLNGWIATSEGPVNAFTFVASIMVLAFLFALFLVAFFLRRVTRRLTSYLRATKRSQWELDWQAFRRADPFYWAYTKVIGIVFVFLGAVQVIFPFVLAIIYGFGSQSAQGEAVRVVLDEGLPLRVGIGLHVGAFILYTIFVYGMSFRNWWEGEDKFEAGWQTVLGLKCAVPEAKETP